MKKILNKFSILTLAIIATLFACLSVSNNHSLPKTQDLRQEKRHSATGAYLSGQHAAIKSDFSQASQFFLDSIERDSKSPYLATQVLDLLIATGKYDQAMELAKKVDADNADSESSSVGLLLYAAEMKEGNFAAAIAGLDSLSKNAKDTVIHKVLLSWTEIGLGDKKKALEAIATADKEGYFKYFVLYNQALIAEIAEENELAGKLYKELLENRKPAKKVAESAYRFFKKSSDFEAAKILLEAKFRDIDLEDIETPPSAKEAAANALNDIAGILLLEQNFGKATIFYRLGLYIEPHNDEVTMLLAAILSHEQDFQASNDALNQIQETSVFFDQAQLSQAQNYVELKNKIAAKKILETLVDKEKVSIEAYMNLGDLARQEEDFAAANENYSAAIEASKLEENQQVFWPVYFARGVTFERLQNWEAAEADFKKALELEENQPDVLNYLAYSLLDMNFEDRFNEALNMLEIAYRQRPNDPHIVDSIGWAWFKKGDYKKAAKHLERAASDMPYDATINDHLGDVYWVSGRKNEAIFAWKRALANDPEERFIEQLKHKLENGLETPEPKAELDTQNDLETESAS